MSSTIFRRATVISDGEARQADVIIDGQDIAALAPAGSNLHCDNEVDAGGLLLLPGVIDEHVHFRDPGMTAKADTSTESRAAAAGGVTSFMDMPNTRPATTTLEALDAKYANAADKSLVNYSYYFGATNHNAPLFASLDKRTVCGIKLFMGSSTGDMLVDDDNALRSVFEGTDMIVAAHCEDTARVTRNAAAMRATYGDDVPVACHSLIRDEEACYRSTAKAVELADRYGTRLHVMHLSTARELTLFDPAPLDTKRITAEACLAHLLFTTDDYDALGARIKCNPSVKSPSDRQALRQALTTGRIDTVATDHAPHLLADKEGGALGAASGMPMLQFSLISMLDLVEQGIISQTEVVEKMCHAPARLYHVHKRGFIREGYRADIALVAPQDWTLTSHDVVSKCGWSPLEGHTFHHRVVQTYVNGRLVYDNGRFDDSARGQRLTFDY